jgi:gliding motility-associated-like protein
MRRIILLTTVFIFCAPFINLNAQILSSKTGPQILSPEIKLSELPVYDSLRLFVKLKESINTDIRYSDATGFTDPLGEDLLKKMVRIYHITSIKKSFARLTSHGLNLIYIFQTDGSHNIIELKNELDRLSEVDFAEQIPLYYPMLIPNDFNVLQTPCMYKINADLAWDITQGSSNIRIAVVDDAVRITHEDLIANCWINPLEIAGNGIDDDNNGYIDDVNGFDVSDNDNNPNPPAWCTNTFFSHGTHVAGIAAASTNNGIGITGVGFNCTYVPVKTKPDLSTGSVLPDAYLGLEYAIISGADIINMSWGGFGYSNTYQLLCTAAHDTGIVMVAAAGNTGTEDSIFPACYEHVISVGSTNLNDVASFFSSYGHCIDVMAPGVDIYSTKAGSDNSYGYFSGTSMASPMVSGICGLMLANNPAMTPDEVEQCLKSSCANINLQNPFKVGLLGSGRVDALGAVTCVEAPPHPYIPGGNCGSSIFVCVGNTITFNGSSLGLAATSWYWQFPGGTPATSTDPNPTVTYNIPGYFDVIVVACNSFGCDTVVYNNFVYAGYPSATLSASNTGTVCAGSAAYIIVDFFGFPPFSFSYTDGIISDTISGISNSEYWLPVFPTVSTTYLITSMTDALCDGSVSGIVTLNPVDCGPCSNTDFEFGNFSTWLGELGQCCGMGSFSSGIQSGRMAIMSGNGTDPYSNGDIHVVSPFGGSYSLRLGNYFVGGEAEIMEKKFIVTPENASFTYEFAVVLEDPLGHSQEKKPKFEIRLMDQNDVLLPDSCAYYQVTAGPETDNWFHNNLVRYQPWTQVTVDLSPYIGQEIKVQFKTEDCGLLGHFGYAYLDARCGPNAIEIINFCSSDDTVTLSAPQGYVSYIWVPSGDTTQSTVIIGPQDGDTVSVTMRNIIGCASTISHIFHVMPAPVPLISADTTICAQDSALIWATGAGLGGSYHWYSDPPGFTSTDDTNWVSPLVTTTYYVELVNSNGCPADTVPSCTVNVNSNLAFTLSGDQIICKGDTVMLFLSAVCDSLHWYSWPPAFVSDSDTVFISPSTDMTYILAAYSGQCDYRDSTKISIYDYLFDNPITQIPICSGTNIVDLSAPANFYDYEWLETGDTTESITILNPVAYSIYSVAMISPYGCPDTLRFILDMTPDPDADAGIDTIVCKGFAVQLVASGSASPNGTYSWTSIPPGFIANTSAIVVSPQITTDYVVEVSNGPGCPSPVSFDTVRVVVTPSPEFELGDDLLICKGDSITLTKSFPGGFDFWESDPAGFLSNDTTVVLKPEEDIRYYLTINTSNCTYSDYINVLVFSSDDPNDSLTFEFCPNDTVLSIEAVQGYEHYYWTHTGDTARQIEIHGNLSDSVFYVLMYDSIMPCKDSCIVYIKKIITTYLPVITASDTILCAGDTLMLSVPNGSGVTYYWYSEPYGFADSISNYVQVVPADTMQYFCQSSEHTCRKLDSVQVIVYPVPQFALPHDTIFCLGDSLIINLTSVDTSFLWGSDPSGFSSNSDSVILNPDITTNYFLTVSNDFCSSTDSIMITVGEGSVLPDTLRYYYCAGDSFVEIQAPDGYETYYWPLFNDSSFQVNLATDVGSLVTYVVIKDSSNPCHDTCIVSIEERILQYNPYIIANDTVICSGEILSLSMPQGENIDYYWYSDPPGLSDSGIIVSLKPEQSAFYYCVSSEWGCTKIDSIYIPVFDIPQFDLPDQISICLGDSILINPEVVATAYLWSDGDTLVPRYLNNIGQFSLTIYNHRCEWSDYINIDIKSDSLLKIPNVFTPNDDQINDKFEVVVAYPEVYYLKVFNRWGEILFETSDWENQWDGKYKNEPVSEGVYFYTCRYKSSCNGQLMEKEGFVHILR